MENEYIIKLKKRSEGFMREEIESPVYDNTLFKKNLECLIKRRNLTKAKVAELIGIGESSLSRYCSIDKAPQPRIDVLLSIATLFGITVDELIRKDLSETEKINIKERKDIRFCEKLIIETNDNFLDWKKWFSGSDSVIGEEIIGIDPYEENKGGFYEENLQKAYTLEQIELFYAKILLNTYDERESEICIIKLPSESETILDGYKLYIKKYNNKNIECGSSYLPYFLEIEIDEELHDVLEKIYETICHYVNYGRDRFIKESIFDEYLNNEELLF